MTASKKITFISHAVADAPVVKAFVNLLESGVGVSPLDIFCVSVKGQGIKPGTEFKSSIHKSLGDASTVVALISENYYNSAFCMCELGGVWLQSKDFIPILVPPVHFSDMKAVLQGVQALTIDSAGDLDQLRDELSERLGIKPLSTPRWTERRDEFRLLLPTLLASLPPSPNVPRAKLEKAEKEKEEYAELLDKANKEIDRLRHVNEQLAKAKDPTAVSTILREGMPSVEAFDQLVDAVRRAFKRLDRVTKEALYHHLIREPMDLSGRSSFTWHDAQKAIQYKELLHVESENTVAPNENSANIRTAIAKLRELEKWLRSEDADDAFYEWYAKEHDQRTPDLEDRAFWDENFW
jgi:hypothetical protein